MLLEPHQTLVARLDAVPQPDSSNPAWTHLGAGKPELVGDALSSMRRVGQRVLEDLLFDLGSDPIRMRVARTALRLDERRHAADLKGPAHLVEGVAVVAHDLARSEERRVGKEGVIRR